MMDKTAILVGGPILGRTDFGVTGHAWLLTISVYCGQNFYPFVLSWTKAFE